jgi:hypothetical protein
MTLSSPESPSRRRLLWNIALATSAGTLLSTPLLAVGEDLPPQSVDDPAAKALKYVEDAKKVKEAAGNTCANCSLYGGKDGSTQGSCTLFKGKSV